MITTANRLSGAQPKKTAAIGLGDRRRLQIGAQRRAIFGGVDIMEGANRKNSVTHDGTAGTATELPRADVAADRDETGGRQAISSYQKGTTRRRDLHSVEQD